jgi:DNA-directed RNA polymerase subunit E'/Rpb7
MSTSKYDNPYIITKLRTKVMLYPEQMTNKLYLNLKDNLKKNHENRCFKNYGYITHIYSITRKKRGILEAENVTSAVLFDIEFSCRLCRPIEDMKIICRIFRVSRGLITAENGPIITIIIDSKINQKIFFTGNDNILRYRNTGGSSKLEIGDFVIVKVSNYEFNNKDDKIKVIGYLEDIATQEDVEQFYTNLYDDTNQEQEKQKQDSDSKSDSDSE